MARCLHVIEPKGLSYIWCHEDDEYHDDDEDTYDMMRMMPDTYDMMKIDMI